MAESKAHKDLKDKAVKWLETEQGFKKSEIHKEHMIGKYKVDVVGTNQNKTVAVECGRITGGREEKHQRVNFLRNKCDHYERFSFVRTDYNKNSPPKPTRKQELKNKYGEQND